MKRLFKFQHGLAYIALAACIPFATTPTQAALLAYDGFRYADGDGTKLHSLATPGGKGWTGAYGETTTDTATDASLSSPGLNYTGFYTPPDSKAMSCGASQRYYRPYAGTYASPATVPDGTYWFSVLTYPGNLCRGGTLCVFGKAIDDPQNGFGVRMDRGQDVGLSADSVRFQAWGNNGGGGTVAFANGFDKTYYILGKVVMNAAGDSTCTIWVYDDPTALPATEPTGGATHTITAGGTSTFRQALTGRTFSTGGVPPMIWDEIRIATTFAEVQLPTAVQPEFSVSPSTAIENQTLTVNWTVPVGFTTVVINPGNMNVASLTSPSDGTGMTTIQAPGTSTAYVLTYTVGAATGSLTNQFTAIAPSYVITPAAAWQGDTITHSWQVPVGCTAVSINQPEIGDVLPYTSGENGTGTTTSIAPGTDTTYILSYTYNSSSHTLTQSFTMGAAYMTIPTPVIEHSPVPITWRIPVGFSAVSLEYGPLAGPYSAVDVTANTVVETGAGTYTHNPNLADVSYLVRFTNAGIGYVLSSNIVIYPEIITNLVAIHNTSLFEPVVNANPMADGVKAYGTSRSHVWTAVPDILIGAQFVQFHQDEKLTADLSVTFTSAKNATFFLILDNRMGDGVGGNNPTAGTDNPPKLGNGIMDWVFSSGFLDSGLDLGLDENPVAGATTIDQSYSIYFRQVAAGETFTFGAQNDGSSRNMYGIAAVSPQVTPVAFVANPNEVTFPARPALQWTVPAGSTVTIDNGIGDVTSITDPVFGTGSTNAPAPVGTNVYTLTYDPPGAATPPVTLAPVTVVVQPHPPVVFTYTVNGASMDFSWPAEYIGWILQQQTNSLGVGLSTNWVDVPGWEGGNMATVPIDPAVSASFFRLRSP